MRPGGRALMFAAGVSLAIGPAAWGATNPQMPSVVTGDLSRRDLRVPANEPSISGNWDSITHFRSQAPVDAGPTPFQPWARDYFEAYGLGERNGTPRFDPNANCLPSGLPRVLAVPFGFEIVQTPDKIIMTNEIMHQFRIIHMDGKPAPAGVKASYFGYSVGHWEADDLVIETTHLNGYTPVDEEGRPKTSHMRVIEHWRKVAPNMLEDTFTLYDPVTYTRPWSGRAQYAWAPDQRIGEYICEENNRNTLDASGALRHK
jgi:hypothetical protein